MRRFLVAMLEISIQNANIAGQISAWCKLNGVKEYSFGADKAFMLASGEILQCRDKKIYFQGTEAYSSYFDWKEAREYLGLS